MSHATGQVLFKDGLILYFEYNGTCDISIPNLYTTREELYENWRKQPKIKCSCGKDEEVEIAANYGHGFYNDEAKACRHCMCITYDPLGQAHCNLDEQVNIFYHLPDWWKED